MSRKCSAATYLFLDRSGYYFRISIPLDLIASFGQKEFRYALKTRASPEARFKARHMSSFVQSIFRDIRTGGTMKQLTETELKQLVENHSRVLSNEKMEPRETSIEGHETFKPLGGWEF
jgi:hypothetical protein